MAAEQQQGIIVRLRLQVEDAGEVVERVERAEASADDPRVLEGVVTVALETVGTLTTHEPHDGEVR